MSKFSCFFVFGNPTTHNTIDVNREIQFVMLFMLGKSSFHRTFTRNPLLVPLVVLPVPLVVRIDPGRTLVPPDRMVYHATWIDACSLGTTISE